MKKHLYPLACVALLAACQPSADNGTAVELGETPAETPAPVEQVAPSPDARYSIGFYNVENLFDTQDDPKTDDAEFLPSNQERPWTEERYQRKLENLAQVIAQLGDADGPEVLGLCEVENKAVLEALVAQPAIKARGYGIVHTESPDGRGIDNALIYKQDHFQVTKVTTYTLAFPSDPSYRSRDLLLVEGNLLGQPLAVVVNHWPSRRGGERESEPRRIVAAKQARSIVDRLLQADPQAQVVLLGDFNDEPTNKSLQEVLRAKGDGFDAQAGELFNAMMALDNAQKGSYKYKDSWNMLDQIVLSGGLADRAGLAYVPESATIFGPEWLLQQTPAQYKGSPLRTFGGRKYLGGYSDHLPVFVQVQVVGQ
jgi:predicted extracellular nuclease